MEMNSSSGASRPAACASPVGKGLLINCTMETYIPWPLARSAVPGSARLPFAVAGKDYHQSLDHYLSRDSTAFQLTLLKNASI